MNGCSRSSTLVVFVAGRVGFWLAVSILHLALLAWSSEQANHLSRHGDPPYRLHVLASIDPVKQVTLFQCYSNKAERPPSSLKYDPSIAREECCRAIQQLASEKEGPIADDVRTSLSIQCDSRAAGTGGVGSLAEVPALDARAGTNLLPSYVFLHAAPVTSTTRRQRTALADNEVGAEKRNLTVWSHLVWDALQKRVLLNGTNQLESAWEVLSSFHAPTLPPGPGGEPAHFHATLHSTLSDSGGMHRLLHVVITSHILPSMKSSSEETASCELDFHSLFYLPSGVFVNVHDAFDHPNDTRTNLRLQLITVKGAIIDEEKPEFVSPSHAILVRIHATIDAAQSPLIDEQHTLSFSMKLHLRYPPSISTAGDFVSRLVVLSPYLVSGTLRMTNAAETYRWTPSREDFASTPMAPQLHVAWVSAGKQADAGIVMVVTLLVLLGGAMSMLRGISKIVEWD